tara:strand:+ start:7106 stop:7645 length:540 start_codon:yes stop_codon:yes gene_type:complete
MSSGPQETCYSRGELDWGGPFELINQDGATMTEADLKGRYSIMFFGFTECPDACPIIMQKIIYALDTLPEGMQKPRAVMISFDPERDTPEKLKDYVENEFFPDDMVGLTGSDDAIAAAAEEFQAKYFRTDQRDSAIGYSFDHTTAIYLMDENWELKSFFLPTQNPNEMAECMQNFLPTS